MTANPGVIDVFEIKSVELENDHNVMHMYKLASAITSRFLMSHDYMTSGARTSIKYQLECKVFWIL
jgi:hypothetical protein